MFHELIRKAQNERLAERLRLKQEKVKATQARFDAASKQTWNKQHVCSPPDKFVCHVDEEKVADSTWAEWMYSGHGFSLGRYQ